MQQVKQVALASPVMIATRLLIISHTTINCEPINCTSILLLQIYSFGSKSPPSYCPYMCIYVFNKKASPAHCLTLIKLPQLRAVQLVSTTVYAIHFEFYHDESLLFPFYSGIHWPSEYGGSVECRPGEQNYRWGDATGQLNKVSTYTTIHEITLTHKLAPFP